MIWKGVIGIKALIVANYAKEHINKFHVSMIKKLKDNGWQVDVACRLDEDVPYCDNAYDLPCSRNPLNFKTIICIRRLREVISKGGYDIVHCHTYAGKIIGILAAKNFRKNGLKIFYSAHGFQYYKGASVIHWLTSLPVDKFLSRYSDVLITINEEDYRNALKYKFKQNKIFKIHTGIRTDRLSKAYLPEKRLETRERLGIPNDAPVLIYIAELSKNKNQISLIKMLGLLKSKIHQPYLLLVGLDHSGGAVGKQIKKRGLSENVKCLGWRDDIFELLKASDIYVASSIREGLGVNIIEAMYCKLPVVAFDNRGHRETIKNGYSGFLVDMDDIKSMSDRIISLCHDKELRKSITDNAFFEIGKFTDETCVNDLYDVYRQYMS